MKRKDKWLKHRHAAVRNIAYAVLYPYARLKYGAQITKFAEQGDRAYLILLNHQTAFDQFFVGMSFRGAVYYLASEDLFSNGFVSTLIRFLVAPIPIKKQATDVSAIKACIRVAREGGTIAIAPEGNRTYSGKTEYMNPSIAFLARKLGLPIALYRIEGGYCVHPRWSDVVRRGKLKAGVSRVIEPEEYEALTNDELFKLIEDGLQVNEANADAVFTHKKRAEYLERAMYVCHSCGLSEFESHGAFIECKRCGKKIEYLPTTELRGVGFDFPFRFVNDWYEYQKSFVSRLDLDRYTDAPMYMDIARLSEVIIRKRKKLLIKKAEISLYGDRIEIGGEGADSLTLSFDDISVLAVLGKNKLNIYYKDVLYQLKGDKRFNALKYVNIFYHYKGVKKGAANGEFLGL